MIDIKADKPIIMCGDMVRATMREVDPKGMTRRVINPQLQQKYKDYMKGRTLPASCSVQYENEQRFYIKYAPYNIGDVLWVRETWVPYSTMDSYFMRYQPYLYKADVESDGRIIVTKGVTIASTVDASSITWKSPIFMPREAARLFLRVTDVRAERLQDISEADTIAEGIEYKPGGGGPLEWHFLRDGGWWNFATHKEAFAALWDGINAKRNGGAYAWEKNPWVWVYEFERVGKDV